MPKVVPDYRNQARETITESASKLIFKSGFQDTGMDEIARNIGVTKGTLYLYFPSKAALLAEACRRNMTILESTMQKAFDGDISKGIENFIVNELSLPDYVKFHWIVAMAEINKSPEIKKILVESYDGYVSILTSFISKLKKLGLVSNSPDPEIVAKKLIAFHNGILLSVMLGESAENAISLFREGVSAILQAPTPKP